MDTLVFDIETQNFFTDPGVGWNNYDALKISVVGVYSYVQDKYFCLEEGEFEKLGELFRDANRLVGFSLNRYDIPVLNIYFQSRPETRDLDLWHKERLDLLEEIEMATGKRVSLSNMAQANLGVAKDYYGADAIVMYREGRMDDLKKYCLEDVRITKELYDLYRRRGCLFVPDKATGEVTKVEFRVAENQGRLL